jgi:hypothetical protein
MSISSPMALPMTRFTPLAPKFGDILIGAKVTDPRSVDNNEIAQGIALKLAESIESRYGVSVSLKSPKSTAKLPVDIRGHFQRKVLSLQTTLPLDTEIEIAKYLKSVPIATRSDSRYSRPVISVTKQPLDGELVCRDMKPRNQYLMDKAARSVLGLWKAMVQLGTNRQ